MIIPSSYLPAYEDGTECSETLAYEIRTPGNYPEESIQHSEHGESLKSRIIIINYSFSTQREWYGGQIKWEKQRNVYIQK
jgi:hypothetical protein